MTRGLAVALWALVAAQSAATLGLALTTARAAVEIDPFYPLVPLAFTTVGTLIAFRRPANAIAWLLAGGGALIGLESLANFVAVAALDASDTATAALAAWGAQWLWIPGFGAIALALLVFPDGRPLGNRWGRGSVRALPWAIAFIAVVAAGAPDPSFFRPEELAGAPPGPRATGALASLLSIAAPGVPLVLILTLLAGVASLVARYRAGSGRERQQVEWLAFAAGLLVTTYFLYPLVRALAGWSPSLLGLGLLAIPAAIGVAVLQHRLFDIDVLISRTIAYASLTAASIGLYAVIVVYAGAIVRRPNEPGVSALAALLVAFAFQPLRTLLQRMADRLLYGERGRPEVALAELGRRLAGTIAPEDVLHAICRTVAATLRLPYVAIVLGDGRIAASHGEPRDAAEYVPVVYQGVMIAQLLCAARPGEARLGHADLALLADLGRQAGAAVHGVALTEELQRARTRLVTTREEERRRIQHDLHDELGPRLASQTLLADAALAGMSRDPERTRLLLEDLRTECRRSLEDVRTLARGLRPGDLLELGLVPVLRETAQRLTESGLAVSFDADDLPPLPAAVEAAVYHIAKEALANVLRHANASRCGVRIVRTDGTLRISIEDDGVGLPLTRSDGIGFASMRERAAELGGTWHAERVSAGGTRVQAILPLDGTG